MSNISMCEIGIKIAVCILASNIERNVILIEEANCEHKQACGIYL